MPRELVSVVELLRSRDKGVRFSNIPSRTIKLEEIRKGALKHFGGGHVKRCTSIVVDETLHSLLKHRGDGVND